MSFADQVVVVTGASSGMGRSLAMRLAAVGAKVGLIARRTELLQSLQSEIQQAGGKAVASPADVGDRESLHRGIETITQGLGPVDLLIANAGVGVPVRLKPFNMTEMEWIMRINYLGVLYAIEAVLPPMLERRQGHIAAVSSVAAFKGMPGEQAYSASKAAVSNYFDGLRLQLRGTGVSVTTLCPGFVQTPMTEHFGSMPFVLSADRAAQKMLRAIRKRKKVYTFPWQMNLLIKLSRWMPDWLVAKLILGFTEKKGEGG